MSYGVKLKVWGDYACFTRPEMKVERVSYDVITPSAARNILQAIYWKPQIEWQIKKIHILKPIRFETVFRNEIKKKANSAPAKEPNDMSKYQLFIEEERLLRNSLILKNVAYCIEADFKVLSGEEGPEKHISIFNRRLNKGQCFYQPYLGCREFPAYFEEMSNEIQPLDFDQDLGYMLFDMTYKGKNKKNKNQYDEIMPNFFRANVKNGTIDLSNESLEVIQ